MSPEEVRAVIETAIRDGLRFAAIYTRKSTEQTGVSDEEKSVTRQVDHARACVF